MPIKLRVFCMLFAVTTLWLAIVILYNSIYLLNVTRELELTTFTRTSILPKITSDPHYILVVIVLSSTGNQDRRTAIRSTWKSGYRDTELKEVTVKFAIGTQSLSPSKLDILKRENKAYNDLLLLPDLIDTYNNLTLKVLQSLIWVDQNLNYSYVLKCDDDSFVQLDRLVDELKQRSSTKGLYWGYFVGNHRPPTEGKWMDTRWFLCDTYLPHALGGGYVLSANVVRKIAFLSDIILTFHNEDATMGAWTSMLDIERKHDNRFETMCGTGQQCPCNNQFLVKTLHYHTVDTIYQMDESMWENGTACAVEQKHSGYCYNWNTIPSFCCFQQCN